jgi:hypothetical protein
MAKEGYKPTSGMQSAARRAIKLKEQGKAKGAGTMVGWTRAGQLARGETLSLSTVKRMYSYFSRHEVDKKGKDWNNSENPSNGKIMWLAWGGDAGFSWSRKIVNREKSMKKDWHGHEEEIMEEIKGMLEDVVNPVDTVIEIPDDESIQKALRAEVTKEQLGMIIEHLMEAIEGMIEVPEEDDTEETSAPEMEDMPVAKSENVEEKAKDKFKEVYKSDNEEEDAWDNEMQKCWTGYTQRGMKEKGGKMVPNCVPVEKMEDLSEADQVKKSIWNGTFIK